MQITHQTNRAQPHEVAPAIPHEASFLREMRTICKQAFALCSILLFLGGCASTPDAVVESKILAFPAPPDPPRFYFERSIRGSVDTTPKDRESLGLRTFATGSDGDGTQFGKPFSAVARKGRIYVSDTVAHTVTMLDPATGTHKEIGTENPGLLAKPLGMAMDGQDNLYVADVSRKWAMVYDRDGNYLRGIGGPSYFDRPSAVAVNPEGTRLFVVDTSSSQSKPEFHRVQAFDAKTGKHLFSIGTRGSEDGQFNLPRAASIGPDGMLYVVDSGNFRVQVFDQDGKFVRKFGTVGTRLGQFARPKGIDIDKQGNIYISDASHANFQIFDSQGRLLMFIGGRGKEDERAKYLLPGMVALDEDGRVYMVDQGYHKVDIYRPAQLKEDEGGMGVAFKMLQALKPKEKGEAPKKEKEEQPKK
ncbi:MAG: 6-bladed beta-propeller [Magnetococcales bacterium]|nr:6-bladed beta-propeller [Magnetococcales bacterium]